MWSSNRRELEAVCKAADLLFPRLTNYLQLTICQEIWKVLGTPQVDLFATALNHRLPRYMSPCPDPQALEVDAMYQRWDNLEAYAFPPLPLLRQVLLKLRLSNCKMILVAPCWPRQPWFTDLLDHLVGHPIALPDREDLLFQPGLNVLHPNPRRLRLHAWLLYGGDLLSKGCQEQPVTWQSAPLGNHLVNNMNPNGTSFRSGALKGKWIHAIPLFPN